VPKMDFWAQRQLYPIHMTRGSGKPTQSTALLRQTIEIYRVDRDGEASQLPATLSGENAFSLDSCWSSLGRSPDLAIEIDLTSHTDVNRYVPFAVREVWI
jgi:Uma2 family endonuclease